MNMSVTVTEMLKFVRLVQPASAPEIAHYYRTIDAAVGIPIILQDIPPAPITRSC